MAARLRPPAHGHVSSTLTIELIDRVAALIQDVSASVLEPRFTAVAAHDVREKSPGEVVTEADEEGERRLTAGLTAIMPAPVVGEEACAATPALLDALDDDVVWLVDPLDGTANFVAGSPDWAVLVSLQRAGITTVSWIWQPATRHMYIAERGSGATRNGTTVRCATPPAAAAQLRGAVLRRFFDAPARARVERNTGLFAAVTAGRMCTGFEYPDIAEGVQHFALFGRTLPWDHAAGALLIEEAGGAVHRLDGRVYRPSDPGTGLLAAADEATWVAARGILD